jgi:hypothetical protein
MFSAIFSFWPALAAGAVAIPVIIHLINRRRYKIVPWAAMRFLLAAQKQTRKRMRIEQLLLLLVRILILACLLFAMIAVMNTEPINAEALWQRLGLAGWGPPQKGGHRIHHVFVLDASLSMNQKVDGDLTAFEVARQQMLKKIADSPSGDGYSVLLLKESPTWLIGEAAQDARKVSREIEAVKPSHGNASVPAALNMVSAKLNEAKAKFPVQAVYFFTDLQNSTWQGTGGTDKAETDREKNPYKDIQENATTVFVDCGPHKDNDNATVTHVEFGTHISPYVTTGMELTLYATVKNWGSEAKRIAPELKIGRAKDVAADPAMQMRVDVAADGGDREIAARSDKTYTFSNIKFDKPGTYAVQVSVPDDALDQDNARTVIISVRDTIPVLLVNGKASADRFERATEYLRLALNPFPAGAEPKWAPLRPKVVTPGQFTEMTDADLETYDCIFWCDAPPPGANDLRKIDAHVRRGGGLIVTLGDNAAEHLERYNEVLNKDDHGLLPARLLKKIDAPKDHHFYFQNTDAGAFSFPPLKAFEDEADRLTLRTARFRNFVQAVAPEGKARTILSFMPEVKAGDDVKRDATLPVNSPGIVEWNPPLSRAQQPAPAMLKPGQRPMRQPANYRGKVILLTSTVNMDWTSWPGSPSFGAMVQELTRLAVSGRLREQSQTVGGMLDAYLPGGVELDVTVRLPGDNDARSKPIKTQLIDDVNIFRWAETDFAGIYKAETSAGHEIPFAVNVPVLSPDQKGSESNLARIDERGLQEGYPGWTFQIVRNALEAMVAGGPVNPDALEVYQPYGPNLANGVLLIALGLLFLEIVLAWYFGHYTTTEGALAQAAPNTTVIAIAAFFAIASAAMVAFGAIILLHERYMGDFLGFLPELLREWFERSMKIEPPIPGEGRNWQLEGAHWLFGLPGSQTWYAILISIGAVVAIFFTYKAEAPRVSLTFKLLLGAVRLCLILTVVWFLLPRFQIQYARTGLPDVVILIDDTRSMGEPDTFQDGPVIEKVKKLSEGIRANLEKELPDKIAALNAAIEAKRDGAEHDPDLKAELDGLRQRQQYWLKQQENLQNGKWRPSRLQLVQAILAQPEPHWIKTLLHKHKTKVHVFHLDINGRATKLRDAKGDAGEIVDPSDPAQIQRAQDAIAALGPEGNDSRLGTAVRQVIDHYRGSGLSTIIMFTDGVTTRDETLSQAAEYAASRSITLFFVGVGDENEQRDLKLHDLSVDDTIYLGDTAVFDLRLTGHGFKNHTVPVILKLKDVKTGKVKEVAREMVKIDPGGKSVRVRLRDKPAKVGPQPYIIEVEPPKLEPNEKPIPTANLKIERTIDVIDTKTIRVLYVEDQPRYEFRYIKFLLEREGLDDKVDKQKKKQKSIELKVLLLDADPDFHKQDTTALEHFPPTLDELNLYDVLIFGDCDPRHNKLKNNLKNIVAYVSGVNAKGEKTAKPGGGVLFVAGAFNNPHRYRGTDLEKVLPVEPTSDFPPTERALGDADRFRPKLTTAGEMHPIFRFSPDDRENLGTWGRLTPMYWHSSKYRPRPAAEVLAVHEKEKSDFKDREGDTRLPLVVQQYSGSGRSMFFGFEETWRWRRGEDESKFSNFWIQTIRYLARGRSTRTQLTLDRQTPYRFGDKIKVKVSFPENAPGDNKGPKLDAKTEVKVTVGYLPPDARDKLDPEVSTIALAKVPGTWGTYEGTWERTREGKYKFRLTNPDVSGTQPDGQKPSAEAIVELPPGELDKLRMDYQEMTRAASLTPSGEFFTLANADRVLEVLPPGATTQITSQVPPTLLWNQWWVFVLIVVLITSEWVMRKMKHLL